MTFLDTMAALAAQAAQIGEHDQELPILEAIYRIEKINEDLESFWSKSSGWAPQSAAELMSKSRLDWQLSLSASLKHWVCEPPDSIPDGDLILGWTNLGSLIEGTIKLFLAVYYEDYKADLENLKQTQAWHGKNAKLLDPDGLRLDVLIKYCTLAKLLDAEEIALCELVQSRRNAVHAFKDRPIGTGTELHGAIKRYLTMLRSTKSRLPYP